MNHRHLNGFSHTHLNLPPNSLSMPRVPGCEVSGMPTYISEYVKRAAIPTPACISRQEPYLMGDLLVSTRQIITRAISQTHSAAIPPTNGATAGPIRRAYRRSTVKRAYRTEGSRETYAKGDSHRRTSLFQLVDISNNCHTG